MTSFCKPPIKLPRPMSIAAFSFGLWPIDTMKPTSVKSITVLLAWTPLVRRLSSYKLGRSIFLERRDDERAYLGRCRQSPTYITIISMKVNSLPSSMGARGRRSGYSRSRSQPRASFRRAAGKLGLQSHDEQCDITSAASTSPPSPSARSLECGGKAAAFRAAKPFGPLAPSAKHAADVMGRRRCSH